MQVISLPDKCMLNWWVILVVIAFICLLLFAFCSCICCPCCCLYNMCMSCIDCLCCGCCRNRGYAPARTWNEWISSQINWSWRCLKLTINVIKENKLRMYFLCQYTSKLVLGHENKPTINLIKLKSLVTQLLLEKWFLKIWKQTWQKKQIILNYLLLSIKFKDSMFQQMNQNKRID